MADVWTTVCATGHRPQHLSEPQATWIRTKLDAAAEWFATTCGTKVGRSGLALGTDTWWAHAVLRVGLKLAADIPFPQQPEPWSPEQRLEWEWLISQASEVRYVGDLADVPGDRRRREAVRLLHARNDVMLAASDAVVTALKASATSGGTYSAVTKASRAGLPIVHLEPESCRVAIRRPVPTA